MTSVNESNSTPDETNGLTNELSKSSIIEQASMNNAEKTTVGDEAPVVVDKAKAEEFKELGNKAFKEAHYAKSIELYTKAIEENPKEASYYGNRSFAYLKSEFYGYALSDANKSIELDPRYIKGYYRRASANAALGKFKLALKDYEYVIKVCPDDKDAQNKYKECDKIARRIAFEKAIAVDEMKKSAFDQIDIETLRRSNVEQDYKGPRLGADNKITPEFVTELMEYFKEQKVLHKKFAYEILFQIYEYFKQAPTLVDINVPDGQKFTICGDVHGQFYDLLNIFKINGQPSETNPYLFNGDFVDRGSFSIEVIFTLFSLKLCYPNHFYLARGNHESITMNQMYGFEGECKSKYSQQMFGIFTEIFNFLPLSHIINSRILCMHGGLFSKDNVTLDDIRAIDRNRQPPEEGLMCDLMWSDPQYATGRSQSKRGVGIQFGPDVTNAFCKLNNIDYVVRSHEVKQEGYECMHGDKCITVFSAPNYCDTMGNKGAFINVVGSSNREVPMTPKFVTYEAVDHPKIKPMAYANAFSMFGLA